MTSDTLITLVVGAAAFLGTYLLATALYAAARLLGAL
jgi:hypothetical protein